MEKLEHAADKKRDAEGNDSGSVVRHKNQVRNDAREEAKDGESPRGSLDVPRRRGSLCCENARRCTRKGQAEGSRSLKMEH
jgi:hypothetical protein